MTEIGYTIIQVATVIGVIIAITELIGYALPKMTFTVIEAFREGDRSAPIFMILTLISILWLMLLGGIIAGIGELFARV